MTDRVRVGDVWVGEDEPCYVIAEIGINHNGQIELAKRLIDAAIDADCQAVKFQKRTPAICVPPDQREIMRETPWGYITYLDYRERIEFGKTEFDEIDRYCRERGVAWFASCWDVPSIDFVEGYSPPCHKIASASMTDEGILKRLRETGRPLLLSTGMSNLAEIDRAVEVLGRENLIILQCTSTYPAHPEELNLRAIASLRERYGVPVGYSGHEVGLSTSVAAAALGACVVERHVTLDRAMWGTDQAASVEPHGMKRLVRDIRTCQRALGDGIKQVYPSEEPIRGKLRGG